MFDRAALFLLDERERLFPRAFLGDRADGDLVEYLPARRIAEIAGEDRRILGERDLGEPAADDRLADILRSEEHTSELQSLMRISYAVFCLKKKKKDKAVMRYANKCGPD